MPRRVTGISILTARARVGRKRDAGRPPPGTAGAIRAEAGDGRLDALGARAFPARGPRSIRYNCPQTTALDAGSGVDVGPPRTVSDQNSLSGNAFGFAASSWRAGSISSKAGPRETVPASRSHSTMPSASSFGR